ncbi:hypothetical protein [uncultured Bacteroides sp.]|uniref:hypothetical protein n=1 Tax=uncultured Bacteroides sp. TaxID=162156 RepID=UPI002AABC954|nr:hypothetical protein [uncultured Bacteroides sp.]
MNKKIKILSFLAVLLIAFTSCQPDDYSMGSVLSKSDLKYSITPSASDPNMIVLKSLTSGVSPIWITPSGRSLRMTDSVKIAFKGDYKFLYGVESGGGVVFGDTVTLNIAQNNLSYVNDPLWTSLTGGVGKEKVWIADNGKYGMAPGAMSYADPTTVVEYNNFTPNWEPNGNANGSTDANMGWGSTMTFSLKGGAIMTTHKINEGGKDEVGTFFLNAESHTLTTTDAYILRADNFIANAANWNKDLKILKLTDNQLRIAVMRTNSEGAWWYIWNYVSKDYADAYVPEDQPDPTPNIGGDPNQIMTTSNSKTWIISTQSPYDWSDLNGSLLNGWKTPEDYKATGWAPYDADAISGIKFTFTSTGAEGGKYNITAGDSELEGTYQVNSENVITFSNAISFPISGWVSFATTSENKLKIVKTKTDALGNIIEMWLGNRSSDPVKKEYQVFHLVLGSGTTTVDAAKELRKLLTNSSTLNYKVSTETPFTWARNASKDFDFTTPIPAWTNWTGSETNLNAVAKVALKFSNDGTVKYTDNKGVDQSGTFRIISGDKADGENLIVFDGITINFEMTGVEGGWVNCNFNTNVEVKDGISSTNDKLPASNFWELYKWEYNQSGKVSGIWFGKQSKVVSGGAAGERMVYHFIVSE